MTRQIVIKLNEKKFKQLLDSLMDVTIGRSYSEAVGKCIFFSHTMFFEKILLENKDKTHLQFLIESLGQNFNQEIINFQQRYYKFVQTGKLPPKE